MQEVTVNVDPESRVDSNWQGLPGLIKHSKFTLAPGWSRIEVEVDGKKYDLLLDEGEFTRLPVSNPED